MHYFFRGFKTEFPDRRNIGPYHIHFSLLSPLLFLAVHQVPLLICPYKTYASVEQQEWSKRFESVRKDIECFFGRLKGRFRLFKTGILFNSREKIDNAWFTACIIHNMLLQFDGLANLEKDMNWTGKDGEADETTGPFPAQTTVGSMDVGAGGDTSFHTLREELVDHFTYKKKKG